MTRLTILGVKASQSTGWCTRIQSPRVQCCARCRGDRRHWSSFRMAVAGTTVAARSWPTRLRLSPIRPDGGWLSWTLPTVRSRNTYFVQVAAADGPWYLDAEGQRISGSCYSGGTLLSGSTCRRWYRWNQQCSTTRRHASRALLPSPDTLPNSRYSVHVPPIRSPRRPPSLGVLCNPPEQKMRACSRHAYARAA